MLATPKFKQGDLAQSIKGARVLWEVREYYPESHGYIVADPATGEEFIILAEEFDEGNVKVGEGFRRV